MAVVPAASWPPRMSCTNGAEPLYGTVVSGTPACLESDSIPKCGMLPGAGMPTLDLPGLALAHAKNSGSVFTPVLLATANAPR